MVPSSSTATASAAPSRTSTPAVIRVPNRC
jgi:hypothetical protein